MHEYYLNYVVHYRELIITKATFEIIIIKYLNNILYQYFQYI